ncbi:hypothetical protein ACE6H2_000779 [Prunus campanulata]
MLRLCQQLAFPNPIAPLPRSLVHSSSSSSSKNYPFLRTSPEISRLRFAMANPSQAVSSRGPITHVIFDMDGLLLDTEKFYTEVQEIILARYNKTFDWSLKAKMMGKKAIEASRVFVEETGISDTLTAEDFLVEREAKLQSMFPTSELMPGASRLIRHLHEKGIPFALATGYSSFIYGAPIDPKKILVFEDAPAGVLAAKNAGMSVVMVPDPRLDSSFYDIADQVLKSLLDLNPNDWGLPPFENPAS